MNIDQIISSPFTFTKRKNYSACDTRPLWKSCFVVLVLGLCGKEHSASLKKIHVANWIAKDEEHEEAYLKWAGKEDRKRPNVRLEPAVDRVINLLVSNRVVKKLEGKISLTEIGIDTFNKLNIEDVYIQEKRSLIKTKKYLSEAAVKRLFEGV